MTISPWIYWCDWPASVRWPCGQSGCMETSATAPPGY